MKLILYITSPSQTLAFLSALVNSIDFEGVYKIDLYIPDFHYRNHQLLLKVIHLVYLLI